VLEAEKLNELESCMKKRKWKAGKKEETKLVYDGVMLKCQTKLEFTPLTNFCLIVLLFLDSKPCNHFKPHY